MLGTFGRPSSNDGLCGAVVANAPHTISLQLLGCFRPDCTRLKADWNPCLRGNTIFVASPPMPFMLANIFYAPGFQHRPVAISSSGMGLLYYIHRQRCWVVGLCDSRTFPGEWITTQGKFLFHRKEIYTHPFPLIPIKGSCTFVNAFGPYVATFCRKHIDRGPKTRKWKETAERSVAQPLDQWFLVTKCGFWPTICSKGAQMF